MPEIPATFRFGSKLRRRIALIGAPTEAGTAQPGTGMGPASLRVAGLENALAALGHQVSDYGDVAAWSGDERPQRPDKYAAVAAWAGALARAGYAALRRAETPVFMGGDHSLSMGSVAGVARYCREEDRELFVLWLDAHADFNTPLTSPSGSLHGMPVAAICGEPGLAEVRRTAGDAVVPYANVYQFGIRSIDREERALLRERGVHVADMRTLDEFGVVASLRQIVDAIQARGGLLHVSLDVDFLDPGVAPGVATPVPGGATYREAHFIMEMLHDSGLVLSFDIAELNPFLDERGRTARLLVELAASLFGRQIIDRALPEQSEDDHETADRESHRDRIAAGRT
ncbi:MAG TPA: arginase [Vicinamibacterales bacterium]|nr:arginase [Vicinamibacterales bacterium]